ncbi:MAG: Pvc16 family protein, partial [Rhodothermales bacterium]|nr:Pvc16 family protein [Rhodothermales bacterium]
SASALADQVELVKVTPEVMSAEEISKLWAAFGASYRPSAAYLASVVLIEAERPVRTPLPVLTRGPRDPATGAEEGVAVIPGLVPPYPTLTEIRPPDNQPSAELGDTVRLLGHHLGGTGHRVVFDHPRRTGLIELTPLPGDVTAEEIALALEENPATDPEEWPAGLWTVYVAVTQDGDERISNEWPLALAPRIAAVTATTAGTTTTVDVTVEPEVRPGQRTALIVGQREAPAEADSWPTDSSGNPLPTGALTFEFEDLASGTYPVRLRVDGVESHLIDRTQTPPLFDPGQQVTVP